MRTRIDKRSITNGTLVIGIVVLFFGASAGTGMSENITLVSSMDSRMEPPILDDAEGTGSVVPNDPPMTLDGGEWIVVPIDYLTIQEAVDVAGPGDTVYVLSGTYNVDSLSIGESVTLIGQNKDDTIICGSGSTNIIYFFADGVTVTNFTIRNSGGHINMPAGISVSSDDNVISDNIFENHEHYAIKIRENTRDNTIENNIIRDNDRTGIFLCEASATSISNNSIENNDDTGICLVNSWENSISGNTIGPDNEIGIDLDGSDDNIIEHNMIVSNSHWGINVRDSSRNKVRENIIAENGYDAPGTWYGGVYLQETTDSNRIYPNSFIHNIDYQAYDQGVSNSFIPYVPPFRGNHWSDFDEPSEGAFDDYHGFRQNLLGGDGIVDMGLEDGGLYNPYYIDEDNMDLYPLIFPFDIVGYWRFDEYDDLVPTVLDSSRHANDGTIEGPHRILDGVVGSALQFDGIDDYVRIPHSTDYKPTDAITIEAWIYIDDFDYSFEILNTDYDHLHLWVDKDTHEIRFRLKLANGQVLRNFGGHYLHVDPETWYHIVLTYDPLGQEHYSETKLYLNGDHRTCQLDTRGVALDQDSGDLIIGKIESDSSEYADGVIDEVRIYDRALSLDEIQANYNDQVRNLIDPDASEVTLTHEQVEGLTTSPDGESQFPEEVYEHVKVTVKTSAGKPLPNILAEHIQFSVVPTDETTKWYKDNLPEYLTCTFTPEQPWTNEIGEIFFTVTADTSIIGDITIMCTVFDVELNAAPVLTCISYDNDTDGIVNLVDMAVFTQEGYGTTNPQFDYNWDAGTVNILDFAMLSQSWGRQHPDYNP